MHFREAKIEDIPQMQIVRNAVKENQLSDPALIKDADYDEYLLVSGKGWVCEVESNVVGFAIADLLKNNIWALFVTPDFSQKGIGKKLQLLMLNWYFKQTQQTIWLGTSPNTQAEIFYTKQGWTKAGTHGNNELKFEMTYHQWNSLIKE